MTGNAKENWLLLVCLQNKPMTLTFPLHSLSPHKSQTIEQFWQWHYRWSWMSGKTWNQPSFTCLTSFVSTYFPQNWFLRMSGLRSSRNLSAAPTLIRAGNLECSGRFWTLGVKPDPMVPHTWGLGHRQQFPRGGRCSNIYKDPEDNSYAIACPNIHL